MKTSFASPNRRSSGIFETLWIKSARMLIGAASSIVNKIFQEFEAAHDRDALRVLTRRQLDDIGLSPFDRDRLLG
jgi:hypothetical protein